MTQLTEVAIYCRSKTLLSTLLFSSQVYLKPLMNITMNVSTANQVGIAKLTNITCGYLKSLCGFLVYDEKECNAVSYHKPCGGIYDIMTGPLDYCDPIVAKANLPISKYTYNGIIFLIDAEHNICSRSAEVPLAIGFESTLKCEPALPADDCGEPTFRADDYQACCREKIDAQLLGNENASAVEISYRVKSYQQSIFPASWSLEGPFEIHSKAFLTLYLDVHTAKSGFKFAQLPDEYSCDSLAARISDADLYSTAQCEELYADHTLDIENGKLFTNICDSIEARTALSHEPVLIFDASKGICNLGRFPVPEKIYSTEEFRDADDGESSGIIAKALTTEIDASGKTLGE